MEFLHGITTFLHNWSDNLRNWEKVAIPDKWWRWRSRGKGAIKPYAKKKVQKEIQQILTSFT